MAARTIRAFLRVLYTVNNNPQYILVKSSSQVPATLCSETAQSATNAPAFARAPLKACLATICDSSPELLQDPARDFSLYVLDPLEAQPLPTGLSHPSDNTSPPRGVAVALGLMSWALESNDSMNVLVTGTIIPNASPSLEVVFAFRETKRIPKPIFRSYPSLGPTTTPGLSHPPHPPHPSHAADAHFRRDQQEQRTLTRSVDFPELYIGPPRRAPGRPEGSTSSKSKVKSRVGTFSIPGVSSSKGVETRHESKQEVGRGSKPKTKSRPPRAPPTHSPFVCGPLTRHTTTPRPGVAVTGAPAFHQQSHAISQSETQPHAQLCPQTQSYSHSTHDLLLGLLSAIPSTPSSNSVANTTPEQQAILLSALQGLLATNPHLLQVATTDTGRSASSGQQTAENRPVREGSNEHDDGDSDIVILDPSTIDTTTFRKPCHRQLTASDNDMPLHATSQESPVPSSQGTSSSPLPVSTPPSGQASTPSPSQTLTPTGAPGVETPTSKHIPATPTPSRTRKRKLDEYIQGEAQSPTSSLFLSPSASRVSSSGRPSTTRQRGLSSPTRGRKFVSLPSVRLPSMLDTMRNMATSGSRLQLSSSGSSARHPEITTAPSNISSDTTSLKRRLNLSLNEFMEEREARKNAEARKRKSETKVSTNAPLAGPSYAVKSASTLKHAQSSPPRSLFRTDLVASSLPVSTCQPALAPSVAVPNFNLSVTSSTSTAPLISAQAKNPLKNFVLPAWARTSTAMLPRLSDELLARQRAEREAKKIQASLRRRESARAKRRRLRAAERPCRETSDEDDAVANDSEPRTLHSSSSMVARSDPLPLPPPPSLPVFASDAVEPIPSSPPPSRRQPVLPVAPSTPQRKPVSPGSALYRTPSKSGTYSLFTPSGQEPGSLFTPSTPSVTPPLTRVAFTPRSPTVLHHSDARKSPRKNVPWTPKRNNTSYHTPRSPRNGRNAPFASPSLPMRTSPMQTGMGTRAFLLPPPSPCTLRAPRLQNQAHSEPQGVIPLVPGGSGIAKHESPSGKQNAGKEKDAPSCEMEEMLLGGNMTIPPVKSSPTRSTADNDQETSTLHDIGDASRGEEEYASSPLPPSSPLPGSPCSSPAKHRDSDLDMLTTHNLVAPDSDILLPFASDSDAPLLRNNAAWLSDDACTASWFTDSEVGAWLTETEAWLTDTEGGGVGPLLTDSDGAWLSDSEGVLSSLPPSSVSNWLSDDADVDTDGEGGPMGDQGQGQGHDGRFDTAAFERAYVALVEHGGRSVGGQDDEGGGPTVSTPSAGVVEPDSWASMMRPLLGAGAAIGDMPGRVSDAAHETNSVVQDMEGLLDGLVVDT